MPLPTTVIGSYPKPEYLPLSDWFKRKTYSFSSVTRSYAGDLERMGGEAENLILRATEEIIGDQVEAGVDVVTDGEVRRENYVHYHCRHLDGFDFDALVESKMRNGAYTTDLPAIRGEVRVRAPFLADDWRKAQAFTDRPVKVTLPGPMTISDTTADRFYNDPIKLGHDLAEALNFEIRDLVDAGCTNIQVDEPLFARKTAQALDYGMENLERCWHGVPGHVTKVMHMCCGYPSKLDDFDYPKADKLSYFDLAETVDRSCVDAVSLEDAHRHNELNLLERFQSKTVILGSITIASSELETEEAIRNRLVAALRHIDKDRLVVAPDCGLGFLPRHLAKAKLAAMCAAARSL